LFADFFAEDTKVGTAAAGEINRWFQRMLAAAPGRWVLCGRLLYLGFADCVHQRGEFVRSRGAGLFAELKPKDFPAARGGEALRVQFAEVIAVRFGISGQRPQHGSGIRIHVRQSSDGGLPAR